MRYELNFQVAAVYALLGRWAECVVSCLSTFRDSLPVPSSRFQHSKTLEKGTR